MKQQTFNPRTLTINDKNLYVLNEPEKNCSMLLNTTLQFSFVQEFIKKYPRFLGIFICYNCLMFHQRRKGPTVRFRLIQHTKNKHLLKALAPNNSLFGFSWAKIYVNQTTNQLRLSTNWSKNFEHISLYGFFYNEQQEKKPISDYWKDLEFTIEDMVFWFLFSGFLNAQGSIVFYTEKLRHSECLILQTLVSRLFDGRVSFLERFIPPVWVQKQAENHFQIVLSIKATNEVLDKVNQMFSA
jgi:hypothetical protein